MSSAPAAAITICICTTGWRQWVLASEALCCTCSCAGFCCCRVGCAVRSCWAATVMRASPAQVSSPCTSWPAQAAPASREACVYSSSICSNESHCDQAHKTAGSHATPVISACGGSTSMACPPCSGTARLQARSGRAGSMETGTAPHSCSGAWLLPSLQQRSFQSTKAPGSTKGPWKAALQHCSNASAVAKQWKR